MTEYIHKDLTHKIIKCFYSVYDELGFGFLENVYENALVIELERNGFNVERQKVIKVFYKTEIVGDYKADIVVDEKVIIELKAVTKLVEVHEVQLVNYLKATGIRVGLLVNFGEKLEFKRKIF